MLIFALDDEPLMLEELALCIREALPDAELRCFARTSHVLAALRGEGLTPEVIFSDIEMPGMGGIELAKAVHELSPESNIVFVTGFPEYTLEAFEHHVSGFVLKPASAEKVRHEMANLRHPPQQSDEHRIRIQCFGDFEVFVDDIPVTFTRSKAKELLAYLVDRRGAKCTPAQIAAMIWEDGVYDRKRQILFSTIRADMIKSLKHAGAEGIVNNDKDGLSVAAKRFACDFYRALAGDSVAAHSFTGEYMHAYSWAETTAAALTEKL